MNKKIFLVFVFISSFIFLACSGDDIEEQTGDINDESINFAMHFDYGGSVEELEGFMGSIDIGGTTYYWIAEINEEQIFWILPI